MNTLRETTVITRKPHKCWGCAREMPAGTKMGLVVSTDMGKLRSAYWCAVCDATIASIPDSWDADDGYGFGDVKADYPDEWAAEAAKEKDSERAS